ncbi:MAG: beta strand repeat-containing protein, partial [Candidatus Paceibacterota bacterium]
VSVSGAGSPGMETAYFGAATRAAVNKFHALHLVELGITAPTGNAFGLTRALLNQVCNGSNGNPGNPGTPGTTGPVSAMMSASQPTGMVVQGQSGARLADITFTGNGTVTSVQLQRIGVSTDTTLTNVYLYDGNTRITDAASVVTGGYINFNASNGLFSVSGSRTITVRADIAGSTSGQSVGVKLNSVTAGGAVSTFSNVMGNALQIANVTTASVDLNLNTGASTVNAGTMNHIVWSAAATVSTRDVNMKAATFKFVGSAPADAITNLSLYVDGTKVSGPSYVNTANNNKVTFDLGSMPFLLKTGSHTIEVRGDIVKGSARTYTFSIENVADLMLEDSNLVGVNVSATEQSSALTQSNSAYTTTTISTGSVTVNVDPAFNATKVTGGATNVPVGQFTLKAYGEDVKVNSLLVTFATTTISTLNNVSLYVNGGQVGTSQNFTVAAATAGGLTYTLGSSLIIPAGQTVTLTVKADIVNTSNAAYTSGTIATKVGGVSSNAQGQSSNEVVTVASSVVTGNTLTISTGAGTFSSTTGFNAITVAPNSTNVKIGSFTLQAGSAENIKVNSIGVNPVVATYGITNLSNLTLKDGSMVLGNPVGNPASGTSTFSFTDIVIPANSSKTFDVYADIGSETSGSVTVAMAATYRGAISNTTTVSAANGVAVTSAASTLAASTLSSGAPVAQFVVGGSTFGVATFVLKTAVSGTSATVRELRFNSSAATAITEVTVGGVTAPVVSGTSTVTGLNIVIGSTGTNVPVTVKYAGYQNTTSGGSLTSTVGNSKLTLTYVEATSGSGSVISNGTLVDSNTMIHVASKPTVTVSSGAATFSLNATSKIGEFTVTADANGKISVASTSLSISTVGITAPELATSTLEVRVDGVAVSNANYSTYFSSTTPVVSFVSPYEIEAGQSKTFSVYGRINGTAQSGIAPSVKTSLTSGATFKWLDVLGGNTLETGAAIPTFPSNAYTAN